MPFASSSPGTVRNPVSRSTAPSCSDTGFTSNNADMPCHDQPSAGRRSARRVRGGRRRPPESRTDRRYPLGKRGAAGRRASRELADTGAGSPASQVRNAVNGARVAGPRDGRHVDWLRTSPCRAAGPEPRVNPAAGRALGGCGSGWQGRTSADGPDSHMGEERRRRVDGGG
jgi:hypothetical protein